MTQNKKTSVCVVGLGYIGLPTAALIASGGLKVHGADIQERVVEALKNGSTHIREPELDGLVRNAVQSGNLTASHSCVPADVFFICVPTPITEDLKADVSYVQSAAQSIAPHLRRGNLVVLESTSPVGTTEKVRDWLQALRPDLAFPTPNEQACDINIAYCPERVLPGHIIRELRQNDRVVGGLTAACTERACEFYRRFVEGRCLPTSARVAEMVKLIENSYRDVNIAFANELSMICDELDVNVREVIEMANHHPRVKILQPGPGVGGHCIAVDPWFIVEQSPETARLIRTARQVNDGKSIYVADRIIEKARECGLKRIACLGMTYKADTDDVRESPSLRIIQRLSKESDMTLLVADPCVTHLDPKHADMGRARLVSVSEAIQSSDIVVFLVAHAEFKAISLEQMENKVILDFTSGWNRQTSPTTSTGLQAKTGFDPALGKLPPMSEKRPELVV